MLVIRDPQMDAFSEAAIERFEDALTAHFKEQLPVHYEALGDAGTRNAIRYGIDRARSYGSNNKPTSAKARPPQPITR